MSPLADRRARVRYEVVGVLRGTLELAEPARVLNISSTGALVETPGPIPVGTLQALQMTIDGQTARLNGRVRRTVKIGQPPNESHAIGVEFLSPPEIFTISVANLIAEAQLD